MQQLASRLSESLTSHTGLSWSQIIPLVIHTQRSALCLKGTWHRTYDAIVTITFALPYKSSVVNFATSKGKTLEQPIFISTHILIPLSRIKKIQNTTSIAIETTETLKFRMLRHVWAIIVTTPTILVGATNTFLYVYMQSHNVKFLLTTTTHCA